MQAGHRGGSGALFVKRHCRSLGLAIACCLSNKLHLVCDPILFSESAHGVPCEHGICDFMATYYSVMWCARTSRVCSSGRRQLEGIVAIIELGDVAIRAVTIANAVVASKH